MAFEYLEEVTQNNYTITGVTDESYPAWVFSNLYSKSTKVIYNNKTYEAYTIIPLPTYYVYNIEADEIYIPSLQTYVSTATFNATNEFENKFIYIDDTDILYEYKGTTPITQHPSTIDFTNTTDWINLGTQLNGYSSDITYPDVSPLYWKDLGYVNKMRAFDNSNSSQTESDNGEITYVFNTSLVDRISMFGLVATEVEVKVHLTSAPESTENTITNTYKLSSRTGDNFYDILMSELIIKPTLYEKIPTASVQTVTVKIRNTGGIAKVGDITLGKAKTLGVTLDGVSNDIKDYSTYTSDSSATDEYAEGGYRSISDFTIKFPTVNMDSIVSQLNKRRGKITVYNLNTESNEDFVKVKGFIRSRPISYVGNNLKSKINIKIEGRIE